MKTFGIILLLLGIAVTILTGLQITMKDLMNVTPQEITNPHKLALYWSPVTALILITAGIIVLIIDTRENRTLQR